MNPVERDESAVLTPILLELTLAANELFDFRASVDAYLERLAEKLGAYGAVLLERGTGAQAPAVLGAAGVSAEARSRGTQSSWETLASRLPFAELARPVPTVRWDFSIRPDQEGADAEDAFECLLVVCFERSPHGSYRKLLESLSALLGKALSYRRIHFRATERNRALLEATPGGILRVSADGSILESNAFGLRLLGLESLAPPPSLLERAQPQDREKLRSVLDGIVSGQGAGVTQFQFDLVPVPGGERRSLEAHAVAFRSPAGQARSALCVVHDVTERRRMQAQLFHAERMGAMGVLAAGVAHEINNPLTYVIANLDLTRERIPEVMAASLPLEEFTEIRKMLDEASQGAERVKSIVRDLKTFSHAQDESPAEVDLAPVIDYAVKLAQNDLRHRARIVVDVVPGLPPVRAGERKLGQVFLNLLLNSAQAIPEGDLKNNEVRITARQDSKSGLVTIEVRDTGQGIPAGILPRIFDPFFTTKGVGGGTGLGLSICHGIILAFGGEITVESELGKGTAFTVHLRPAGGASEHAAPVRSRVSARGSLGVLIVDRDPQLAEALRRTLRKEDRVSVAHDSGSGLEHLRFTPFDLVFCDLRLAGPGTGIAFFENAVRVQPELASRFVFLTDGNHTEQEREFLGIATLKGARRLEKPFDPSAIRELARTSGLAINS